MNQFESEDRLAKALRLLAQESDRNAPPELGLALGGAFRRHHRRRRIRNSAVVLLLTGCFLSTTWLLTKPSPTTPRIAAGSVKGTVSEPTAVLPTPMEKTITPPPGTQKAAKRETRRRPSHGHTQLAARENTDFLPLPSYDPSVAANNELQIIRLRMPIQDLRLVGAPVNVAMPNRQVLADFVVGQDGTPYAVRVIH